MFSFFLYGTFEWHPYLRAQNVVIDIIEEREATRKEDWRNNILTQMDYFAYSLFFKAY